MKPMRGSGWLRVASALVVFVLAGTACDGAGTSDAAPADRASKESSSQAATTPSPTRTPRAAVSPDPEKTPINKWVTRRPEWLGTRVLPERPDGFGVVQTTPRIFRDRRLPTIDLLPPPEKRGFEAAIGPVPPEVVKRSSWRPKCPVTLEQLAYITMPFRGFDHRRHTGEMIVNAAEAENVVEVFRALYEARFRIEEMRVVTLGEQRAPPTGDTNVTSSFECRQVTLGTSWSQHSYGLAIDVNPFHNPYVRGDLIAPELASAYADRTWRREGMIFEGDVATRAFDAIGWEWGGRWNTLKDWMHFSQTGH
jgi:hypothetical protein